MGAKYIYDDSIMNVLAGRDLTAMSKGDCDEQDQMGPSGVRRDSEGFR